MRNVLLLILFILNVVTAQTRSLIFPTGAPDGEDGFNIHWDGTIGSSISDRFYLSENVALEALKIYTTQNTDPANATITIQEDDNGIPGENVYSWDVDIASETHGNNYILIITTDLCIYLDRGNFYWLTLYASDTGSQFTWIYTNNPTYTYTLSTDQGANWEEPTLGTAGSLSIWAELIYEQPLMAGDFTGDFILNVLDIVAMVSIILSTYNPTSDQIEIGDLNNDLNIDVLDVISLVADVLSPTYDILSQWEYYDLNPNSEYYNELIGPETFLGNVSLYYFGKAG